MGLGEGHVVYISGVIRPFKENLIRPFKENVYEEDSLSVGSADREQFRQTCTLIRCVHWVGNS